jgi:hypothetical protein
MEIETFSIAGVRPHFEVIVFFGLNAKAANQQDKHAAREDRK